MIKELLLNFRFAIQLCFKYDKKLFILKFVQLAANWILTFSPLLLTRELLNAISMNLSEKEILIRGSFYFFLVFASRFFCKLLDKITVVQNQYFEKKYIASFSMKAMDTQYAELETAGFRDIIQLADDGRNIFAYIDYIFKFLSYAVNLISCIGVMLSLNIVIALISVVPCIIKGVIDMLSARENNRYFKVLSSLYRREKYIENYATDISGAKEIRVHGLQKWLSQKYRILMHEQDQQGKKLRVFGVIGSVLNNFAVGVQTLAVYLIISYQILSEKLLGGDFTFYLNAVFLFSDSLSGIVELFGEIAGKNILISSLRRFINNTGVFDEKNKDIVSDPFECIRFENVYFKYPNSDEYVLKNVNFTIHKGERIMIVGGNGAGKTTFIKLLCRFYKPTRGNIYLNDVNIDDINYSEYIKYIGTVFQDFSLIAATVRENTICSLTYDEEKIKYAYQESGFADRLTKMPEGDNTEVYKIFNESGVELSGGEAQKLAIARLIYRNPYLFILDEPTSALDPIAEYTLYQKFAETVKGKTSIFISHRLAGADTYDRILVFDHGEIVEEGAFNALLKNHAVFSEMYKVQSGYYKKQ